VDKGTEAWRQWLGPVAAAEAATGTEESGPGDGPVGRSRAFQIQVPTVPNVRAGTHAHTHTHTHTHILAHTDMHKRISRPDAPEVVGTRGAGGDRRGLLVARWEGGRRDARG
jgi:hypothetical protein